VPIPFASGAKLHQREIPGDDHGHDALLAGLQSEAHRDRASQGLSATYPLEVVIGEASILRESSPNLIAANFVGNEGILIRNFHARRFEGRNGKLPVPIILNVAGTNAVKHH